MPVPHILAEAGRPKRPARAAEEWLDTHAGSQACQPTVSRLPLGLLNCRRDHPCAYRAWALDIRRHGSRNDPFSAHRPKGSITLVRVYVEIKYLMRQSVSELARHGSCLRRGEDSHVLALPLRLPRSPPALAPCAPPGSRLARCDPQSQPRSIADWRDKFGHSVRSKYWVLSGGLCDTCRLTGITRRGCQATGADSAVRGIVVREDALRPVRTHRYKLHGCVYCLLR